MTDSLLARVNPGIAELSPYEPGKPVEALRRELGLTDIIKLASNENPNGPAPAVRRLIHAWDEDPGRYPDGNGFALRQRLAQVHDIAPGRITLGNGSNDILELAARAFLGPGRKAVYSQHCFAVYPLTTMAASGTGVAVPALDHNSNMPLGHDLEGFARALDDAVRVVFIATPNNPTGTWSEPQAIQRLLEQVPDDVLVVLDEAYREYQDPALRAPSRDWLERFPNLLVVRTFSKVHGLAGLRVGYGLSSTGVADLLNRIRQPFNVNALAQACAVVALDATDYIRQSVQGNKNQRARLQDALQTMHLAVLPSQTNFLSFDCGREAAPVFQALLREGVIVRPLAGYAMPRHLRVTVGTAAENSRFLEALDRVLAST